MSEPFSTSHVPIEDMAQKAECGPPWLYPGPEKEKWKSEGNYLDYRELKRSRPIDLKIVISPPRQFRLK